MADRKLAIRRLVRGVDGTMRLIFVDLITYQPIEDMTGYQLVDASNPPEPEEVESVDKPDAEKPVVEKFDQGETGTAPLANPPAKMGSIYSSSANQRFPNAPQPQAPLSAPVGPVARSPLGPVGTPPKGSTPGITGGSIPSGFVKTNQGSVLPELDLNRFSPITKENLNGQPPTPTANNQPAGIAGGLARTNPSIDYSEIGSNRPNPVAPEHERFMSSTAEKVLGSGAGVKVNSGDVNPTDAGWTAEGGKYSKSHRHTNNLGADVRFVDPKTGKVTSDPNVISDIAMQAAATNPKAGLGYGENYMGMDTLHIDQANKGGSWGGGFVPSGTDVSNIDFARQTGIGPTPRTDIPTPTAKPDLPSAGFVSADEREFDKSGGKPTVAKQPVTSSQAQLQAQNLAPGITKTNSVFDQISPRQDTVAQDIIDRAKNPTVQAGPQKTNSPSGKVVTFAGPGVTGTLNPGGYSETVREGSRNWRNNNPGNLEFGNFAKEKGAIGTDGRFAVFDTYEQGRAAKKDLLFETDGYKNKTIQQAVERYAPAFENNVSKYSKAITDALGLPSDTKLSSLTADQRDKMLDAMERHEGFREGQTKTRLTEKGIAAGERWTGPGTGADTPKERNAAGLREMNKGGFVSSDRERDTSSKSTSKHSTERERDTSLGKDKSSSAKSSSSGGKTSSHSKERERDTSLGASSKSSSGKSSSSSKSSKSPTNDGNGGKKSPGGGF